MYAYVLKIRLILLYSDPLCAALLILHSSVLSSIVPSVFNVSYVLFYCGWKTIPYISRLLCFIVRIISCGNNNKTSLYTVQIVLPFPIKIGCDHENNTVETGI